MFLDLLDPFLDKKQIQNYLEVIFLLKEFTKKNFSSKFQFSAKAMMTPPGDQTVTKKFWLVVNSEIFKGIKNMFNFCGHFFLSYAHVQANCVEWLTVGAFCFDSQLFSGFKVSGCAGAHPIFGLFLRKDLSFGPKKLSFYPKLSSQCLSPSVSPDCKTSTVPT